MKKSLKNDLDELERNGIIDKATADAIKGYYSTRSTDSSNILTLVFGVLGAAVIGLGIILIIAHNWDYFPRFLKTTLAFLPLLVAHILGYIALVKKNGDRMWRESTSVLIFFTIAACISLVSQIYQIQGNLSSFLLSWMILSLPLIYLMNSSALSLLFIAGISYYAGVNSYEGNTSGEPWMYWILLCAILPFYYRKVQTQPQSNTTALHHWFILLSISLCLGTLSDQNSMFLFIAYISFFGLVYIAGNFISDRNSRFSSSAFSFIGLIGTMSMAYSLSFDWFWNELQSTEFSWPNFLISREFITAVLISIAALLLLTFRLLKQGIMQVRAVNFFFLVFIILFALFANAPVAKWIISFVIFLIGLDFIWKGAKSSHIFILNLGLIIISVLVCCRFFDTEISFVTRGIVFIVLGIAFFIANYQILNKKKASYDQKA